ncbi:uncharacterized protein J3D65DRAFT_149101 [Phyllosticta citribraziliensis]|uniref:Uncharacterized protein n=1 Tax=Phyllosticta citribraziliensis TaxID=989973 RepID=A0ABR1L4M1_9PEZI
MVRWMHGAILCCVRPWMRFWGLDDTSAISDERRNHDGGRRPGREWITDDGRNHDAHEVVFRVGAALIARCMHGSDMTTASAAQRRHCPWPTPNTDEPHLLGRDRPRRERWDAVTGLGEDAVSICRCCVGWIVGCCRCFSRWTLNSSGADRPPPAKPSPPRAPPPVGSSAGVSDVVAFPPRHQTACSPKSLSTIPGSLTRSFATASTRAA